MPELSKENRDLFDLAASAMPKLATAALAVTAVTNAANAVEPHHVISRNEVASTNAVVHYNGGNAMRVMAGGANAFLDAKKLETAVLMSGTNWVLAQASVSYTFVDHNDGKTPVHTHGVEHKTLSFVGPNLAAPRSVTPDGAGMTNVLLNFNAASPSAPSTNMSTHLFGAALQRGGIKLVTPEGISYFVNYDEPLGLEIAGSKHWFTASHRNIPGFKNLGPQVTLQWASDRGATGSETLLEPSVHGTAIKPRMVKIDVPHP